METVTFTLPFSAVWLLTALVVLFIGLPMLVAAASTDKATRETLATWGAVISTLGGGGVVLGIVFLLIESIASVQ